VIALLLRLAARLALALVALSVVAVLVVRVVNPPLTPLMVIRVVQGAVAGRVVAIDRRWVALDAVSPSLLRAVIASEDARFFDHHGFDFRELDRAWQGSRDGERLRGASTITMQVAKNVYLWPGRTWLRKGVEAWLTLLIELLWSKRRILEVYVNVAEWGDGIYGVEAASLLYFGVPAAGLGERQASLLAAALPSPLRSDPAAPSRYLSARAARIRQRMGDVDLAPLGPGRNERSRDARQRRA
jgi:monofunctional biosynthetic peptidoglycan transglycosylase